MTLPKINSNRPLVGFIPVYHPLFGLEGIEQVRRDALAKLKEIDIEVFVPSVKITRIDGGMYLRSNIREVCRKCVERDVDLTLVLFCSWVSEEVTNAVAVELLHYPVLLWAVPEPPELLSPCGLISTSSNWLRLGRESNHVFGPPDDPNILGKIRSVAMASWVAKRVKRSRIGVIGYWNPGMIDTTIGESELRALGPELVHLGLPDLISRFERADQEKASSENKRLMKTAGKVMIEEEEALASVKLYLALRELVDEHGLDAVGVRCWPELREERGLAVCHALSRLSDEGIPGICENDATGGLTQLIMYWLTGHPTFNGDLSAIYSDLNVIQLWHCGAAPLSLASGPKDVVLREHPHVGKGAVTEFPLKPGRATLAKLGRPIKGKYKMLITTGQVIETPTIRGNPCNVKIDVPLDKFMEAWISNGFEHHLILAYGDIREELLELCRLLHVESIVP